MRMIAYALANGNPFAYLLLFILFYPPVMIILFWLFDKIKSRCLSGKKADKYKL